MPKEHLSILSGVANVLTVPQVVIDSYAIPDEEVEKIHKVNDEEIIKSFMLPKNTQTSNLDNFVKIKKTQEEKVVKLPTQREMNLTDNQFKTKGIKYE